MSATRRGADPAIRLQGLGKDYGPRHAVRDLTLDVEPHQVFGYLGPNGAGKTTTIRLMMGLCRPSVGSVEVLGQDAVTDGVAVRKRVGYLPGETAVHPRLTGREMLDRVARLRGDVDPRVRASLERRFDAELDRPLRALSTGNRQKVAIVRALMHDPELLVLDEPTTGLDPLLQREFADILEELVGRGRTVFLSSHDLDEVQRLAHQIAVIRDGRLVTVDTVQGLRERSPRRVELTFAAPVDPAPLTRVPGVHLRSADGPHLDLTVTGEVGRLVRAAAGLDLVDVVATPADLDELFRTFYRASEETDGAR